MPRERALSEVKEPHLISLKVLRLSRPSLSEQHALPASPALAEATRHSHAYPTHDVDNAFIFTPLLTLPPAFGSVYIGETFSCILSASNEQGEGRVRAARIRAQMQTPSQTVQLDDEDGADADADVLPGASLQRIVAYDLKEEGAHTLAVTVCYSDHSDPPRVRTFKKLYQFVAQQCIMVRTKATALPATATAAAAVLEAQLENLSDSPVTLSCVSMKTAWAATSLNRGVPMLRSRDVVQVAFLLELAAEKRSESDDIGQLSIEWKTACGDRGFLRTGRLFLPPA